MSALKDRIAIVTGAGTGIGRAIVEAFAAQGAKLALVGRRPEMLEQAARDLDPDRTRCFPCDVSDRAAVEGMVRQVRTRLGTPDILVNNAGINTVRRALSDVDPRDWDRTIAINLTGSFNCLRAVLPGMRDQGGGLIINIVSTAGRQVTKVAGAAYCASKHGQLAMTHSINAEERPYHIRATAICPGEVATPILDQRPEPVGPERRAAILQPQDVAAAALFVAALPSRVCVPELVIVPAA